MKSIHRRQGALAAGGQEGERHSPLQGPWGPEGELHGGDEAEVKGVMISARGPLGSGG